MIIDKKNFTILFNGDSITHGNRGSTMDCNHILGHGYQSIIASKLGLENLDKTPKFYNRGISGQGLRGMLANWDRDVYPYKPDLISILIGINDSDEGSKPGFLSEWTAAYDGLLTETKEKLPDVCFVLMEPFFFPFLPMEQPYKEVPHPLCEADFPWPARNNKEEGNRKRIAVVTEMDKIVAELAEKHRAVFVPLQERFNELAGQVPPSYLIWDGVHPSIVGHQVIADCWLKAVID